MSMRHIVIGIGVFALALTVGYLGYAAYTYHYAYTQQTVLLRRLQLNLLNAPQWRYGTITAINQSNSTVQLQLANSVSIQATIANDAYIGRQDLISENGIYIGALPSIQATFADLQAGQHVAVGLTKDTRSKFVVLVLLFGNPI